RHRVRGGQRPGQDEPGGGGRLSRDARRSRTDTGAAWRALLRAAADAGLDCPRDASLALLGSPPADLADGPEPTGFDIPRTRLGAAAVRMLAALVAGEEATEPLVACAFRPGATSGPPPAVHGH
ncbi:substrate-binding domain-containing protein, partial [Streptomyces sp. NPDC088270]|uniref:substrate-binding domain-containing protein n=1 Tax=Streptomyces sp. NPDC088270 TaxID=3160990 RepID=UPI003426598A